MAFCHGYRRRHGSDARRSLRALSRSAAYVYVMRCGALDGVRLDGLAEADLTALGVDHHGVALDEVAVQELERQRVLDQALDRCA